MRLDIPKKITPTIVSSVAMLDLVTKHLAAKGIAPGFPVEVLPFFNLVNVHNKGAAFGMFGGLGNMAFVGISVAAIAFIIFLLVRTNECPLCLSLILAGAIGNLYDRIVLGYVRDFLDFHVAGYHWPAFNVADSALTVGLGLLFVASFRQGQGHK